MLAVSESSSNASKRISSTSPMVSASWAVSCASSGVRCQIAMCRLLTCLPENCPRMTAPFRETGTVTMFHNRATDLQGRRQKAVLHRPGILDDDHALELFMPVQPGVDLVQPPAQQLLELRALVERLALAGFREHAERHGLRQAIADHAHQLDVLVLGQAVLDGRRRHVLALAGLEDLLDPPGQAQEALGILLALVPGAQEAVLGEGLGGHLRLAVVAEHDRLAADLHLALGTDAYLHARVAATDPARLDLARPSHMGVAAVLGHAVDLLDLQAQPQIPVQQGLRHRGAA